MVQPRRARFNGQRHGSVFFAHKLLDRGALGLDQEYRILVSAAFSARTEAAKRTYDLQSRQLRPRRGTALPAAEHVDWHGREVFRASGSLSSEGPHLDSAATWAGNQETGFSRMSAISRSVLF